MPSVLPLFDGHSISVSYTLFVVEDDVEDAVELSSDVDDGLLFFPVGKFVNEPVIAGVS